MLSSVSVIINTRQVVDSHAAMQHYYLSIYTVPPVAVETVVWREASLLINEDFDASLLLVANWTILGLMHLYHFVLAIQAGRMTAVHVRIDLVHQHIPAHTHRTFASRKAEIKLLHKFILPIVWYGICPCGHFMSYPLFFT